MVSPPFSQSQEQLLYALLIGGKCLESRSILVGANAIVRLPTVDKAQYALLIIEANSNTSDKAKVLRLAEAHLSPNGEAWTVDELKAHGLPLGDLSAIEVKGTDNLAQAVLVGIEAGLSHRVNVQYYG